MLQALSTSDPRRITREFAAFVVAGGTRAVLAYVFFAAFLLVGFHYALATLFAGVFGIISGYLMNRRFVFAHEGESRLVRFLLAFGVGYLLSVGSQRGLIDSGWVNNHYLGGAIAAGICAIPNFLMNKYFVFWSPRQLGSPCATVLAIYELTRSNTATNCRRLVRAPKIPE
ncbi:MAG: GtrA family protein [Vicinamibacterales bacterium]